MGDNGWRKISTEVRNGDAGWTQPEKTLLSTPLRPAGDGDEGWGREGDVGPRSCSWLALAVRTEIQVLKLSQFRIPHTTLGE